MIFLLRSLQSTYATIRTVLEDSSAQHENIKKLFISLSKTSYAVENEHEDVPYIPRLYSIYISVQN